MITLTNPRINTSTITNILTTTTTAMGTRLTSMIRNTRRSLIGESRGFALILPRN